MINLLEIIESFDNVNIIKKLSSCSLGEVYVGNLVNDKDNNNDNDNDKQSKSRVIIKILEKIIGKSENKIKRETEIPLLLDHPNIVKILDIILTEKYVIIMYPYLHQSISLNNISNKYLIFNQKSKNFVHCINIMILICDAVNYLHLNNIYHRDIKPHNIVFNFETAILIDFDLADSANNINYPIKQGMIGSYNYMAPELIKTCSNIDYEKTDIYSFGVTMFYLFNKKSLPYVAETIDDLESKIRHEKPTRSNSYHRILNKLIMRVINKDPLRRPSINTIKLTLQKILG